MFEVIFEADNGKKFVFGRNGSNYFGMNIGNGVDVALGTSQGFSQIGETVETQGVSGRPIDVTGEMYGDITQRKDALRNVCAPMTAGRLVFQKSYYIRVYVKAAPTFSAKKGNGRFKMQFFAPFPFFSLLEGKSYNIGQVEPMFSFPVNYGEEHMFGVKSAAKATNVANEGDVRVPFRMDVHATGESTDMTVTNLHNLAFLRILGKLQRGDRVAVYRDESNSIRAELTRAGETTDIMAWIDEESTLFELEPGENLLAATDDQEGNNLTVQFSFHPARAALYET